mmetsp:Transcript_25864/g.57965  ORF Transcript_25864/g.57965 Transcript_25864/m.57965 type:complete len:179 (+) Transcript_25864:150-686(+)|eukprot:CAMPEP_0172616782 /NCGR_PEP_ID=MMETSP1068-20121228/67492_1 /TAXON_ID=35684 /ORGANISM="Pseudopedinella elastica, Strain CCMP716" /LENGTH=178 /DNA_ID=CAMNT_0013422335 /DNA_START=79 /DNA_END=615 /DNA_ORIENTATION=+
MAITILLASLFGVASSLVPSVHSPAAASRRGFLSGLGGAASAAAALSQRAPAARADELSKSDALALLREQYAVLEDLEDECEHQPGVPAWSRKAEAPDAYVKFEDGMQAVNDKVLPVMTRLGDGNDRYQMNQVEAFRSHARSAVFASKRPETKDDRRKAQFEVEEAEQALDNFLRRMQ